MICSNLKFGTGPFSGKYHGPRYFVKQAQDRLLILAHHLKGLSLSFQKINVIGPTVLPFKDACSV